MHLKNKMVKGDGIMARSIKMKPLYLWKISLVIFAAIAYFHVPGLQVFLVKGTTYLRYRDFEGLRQFILSYGLWAPVVSITLMVVQSLVPLVPGLFITIANAWIFGWQQGAFYSWAGGLLGALLDFGVARWYGRSVVRQLVNDKYLDKTDEFIKKNGLVAVFITRLTPIIPFKVVSYGAGLTTMCWWRFMIANGIVFHTWAKYYPQYSYNNCHYFVCSSY
jgi:uncharacterized membrane protein YdjX (TVP38/TMEM64 family)